MVQVRRWNWGLPCAPCGSEASHMFIHGLAASVVVVSLWPLVMHTLGHLVR